MLVWHAVTCTACTQVVAVQREEENCLQEKECSLQVNCHTKMEIGNIFYYPTQAVTTF